MLDWYALVFAAAGDDLAEALHELVDLAVVGAACDCVSGGRCIKKIVILLSSSFAIVIVLL